MATRHPRDAFFMFSSTNVPLRRGRAFLAAKIPSRRSVSRQQGGATARDARDASPATFSIFVIHPIDVTWKNIGTSNGPRLPPPPPNRRAVVKLLLPWPWAASARGTRGPVPRNIFDKVFRSKARVGQPSREPSDVDAPLCRCLEALCSDPSRWYIFGHGVAQIRTHVNELAQCYGSTDLNKSMVQTI